MEFTAQMRIFFEFIKHDIYVYSKRFKMYGINYILLLPINYLISMGYLQVQSYFGSQNHLIATELFAGNMLFLLMGLSFQLTFPLLYDIESNNHTSYQLLLLSPRWLIIEKIVFTSCFSFVLLSPFYPICKLFLRNNFDTTHTSWIQVFLILFLAVVCATTYHLLAACVMKHSNQIGNFWVRVNSPLEFLGGFWTPLYIIQSFSVILGYIALLNPFIYITEGLRQAFLGTDSYLSLYTCIIVLSLYSLIFTCSTFYFFKKKTDCI